MKDSYKPFWLGYPKLRCSEPQDLKQSDNHFTTRLSKVRQLTNYIYVERMPPKICHRPFDQYSQLRIPTDV